MSKEQWNDVYTENIKTKECLHSNSRLYFRQACRKQGHQLQDVTRLCAHMVWREKIMFNSLGRTQARSMQNRYGAGCVAVKQLSRLLTRNICP